MTDRLLPAAWLRFRPTSEDRRCQAELASRLLVQFNAIPGPADEEVLRRDAILRELLGELGEDSIVVPRFRCDNGRNIFIGRNTFVNYEAVFMDWGHIVIGDNVLVGPRSTLVTVNHPVEDTGSRDSGAVTEESILIEDGVWLGANVTVCPGVRIGAGTAVGAGSVVVKSLPAGVFAAGSPARPIKDLVTGQRV